MRAWIRRHPLWTFFVLAYAISWGYWIPLAVTGQRVAPGSSVTHFPGLLGPALAAFLTALLSGDTPGVRSLGQRLIRVSPRGWRFWFYSLSPLAFLAVALVIVVASRAPLPPIADFARYSGLPPWTLPVVLVLVLVFNGFGEETGWRGFALPRLQARFGPLGGTLVLAVLWAGWHAPTFAVIETYRSLSPPLLIFGFGLGIVCGAIVLSHVAHVAGGSILAAALWHAAYNMTSATAAGRGLVGAVTTSGVMAWAVWLLVAELRRPRGASLLAVPLRDERPEPRAT